MSQIVPGKIIQFYRRKVSGVDKVVNFKDFSRRNKEIKYFRGTQREYSSKPHKHSIVERTLVFKW